MEEIATHSGILAWRISWTEELGYCSPWDCKKSDTTEAIENVYTHPPLHTHTHTHTHTHICVYVYMVWGSQGKDPEVVCHSLLQWTSFCQTSPPWPIRPGWPHTAWLWVRQAVVSVIRLASCLWLCFQSVCPLMPSLSTYRLTSASLSLGMGYLFTDALCWSSCSSLSWMWGSSSQLPPLTLDVGYLLPSHAPDLEVCSSTWQLLCH